MRKKPSNIRPRTRVKLGSRSATERASATVATARERACSTAGVVAIFAAWCLLALPSVALSAPLHDEPWYWGPQKAANSVYHNGVSWGRTTDQVARTNCSGFGGTISSGGQTLYRHFYCTVSTQQNSLYAIIVHVRSHSTYSIDWDGSLAGRHWYYTPQKIANALYRNGVRWTTRFDTISSDRCVGFAPLSSRPGFYRHFYCTVQPQQHSAYGVDVTVIDARHYAVLYDGAVASTTPSVAPPAPVSSQRVGDLANASSNNYFAMELEHSTNRITWGSDYPPIIIP
jgi:hypothetical protein